jgi:hypothetical protein
MPTFSFILERAINSSRDGMSANQPSSGHSHSICRRHREGTRKRNWQPAQNKSLSEIPAVALRQTDSDLLNESGAAESVASSPRFDPSLCCEIDVLNVRQALSLGGVSNAPAHAIDADQPPCGESSRRALIPKNVATGRQPPNSGPRAMCRPPSPIAIADEPPPSTSIARSQFRELLEHKPRRRPPRNSQEQQLTFRIDSNGRS